MDRVALLHTGGLVGRFFNQYVYLPFPVSADEARRIAEHHRLRGIVVQDRLMRRMFEVLCKGEKEVLLHPAMIDPDESGPSCIVACGQMFRSRYRSPGRGRRWESLRVRPYDLRSGTLYLKDSPWSRTGDVPELWVDVIGADDTTVRAVKVRAERLLREKKKEA